MIFIRYPFRCNQQLDFQNIPVSSALVTDSVRSYLGSNDFSLLYNGRKLYDMEVLPNDSTIHVVFSLPGGKGGFGSMLRAIGAQIEKTTNREACRDLSGRRLRDINEEQRLKKWIAKEAEREAEKVKRRQARIERLKTKAPHKFFDYEYEKEISALPDRINDALSEGLEKSKDPKKRPYEKSGESKLPKKSWLSDDLPMSSSDSDSDEQNPEANSPSKRQKLESSYGANCNSDMSESSEPQPCSSKDGGVNEQSSSSDSNSNFADAQRVEYSNDSDRGVVQQESASTCDSNSNASCTEMSDAFSKDSKMDCSSEELPKENGKSENCNDSCVLDKNPSTKQPEEKEDFSIELLDFKSISDLEELGLDRLKSALMARGLKCGGTLSDRAHRLWEVRGLQPHEYPSKLLAKNKK